LLNNLDEKIKRAEGMLCGLILKEPNMLDEYAINKKLLSTDALFYIGITERLLSKGIEVIDEASFYTEVESIPDFINKYNQMGGYSTIKELSNIVDIRNSDAIYDDFTKWNVIKKYKEKGILDIDLHWEKLLKMNTSQVVDYMEYQLNDIDINVNTDIVIETLDVTDKEHEEIKKGINMGINYGKHSPILNYLSMGLPKGDLTMFSSYTNGGKSSYTMNNIIIPIAEQKIKTCIVANEQKSMVYKQLLQIYVLTEKLNYYSLTRKKLKSGKWTEEDEKMLHKARQIIKEEYSPYISFVKLYDYDMSKVNKIVKKLSKTGLEVLLYDTMKYSGEDESVWLSLIQDSKDIFQICSKNNIAGVITFQLAPGLKNKIRMIDVECLSNGKQVAEVFSEMIGFRDIWDDEFEGETYDIKPYKLKKVNGKFTDEKEKIILDKNKKYKIFFHFKTRNDEVGTAILYEFRGHLNKWVEIGYCLPHQKNRY
jgi:hypothetical protein